MTDLHDISLGIVHSVGYNEGVRDLEAGLEIHACLLNLCNFAIRSEKFLSFLNGYSLDSLLVDDEGDLKC